MTIKTINSIKIIDMLIIKTTMIIIHAKSRSIIIIKIKVVLSRQANNNNNNVAYNYSYGKDDGTNRGWAVQYPRPP